jgi:hypothetical protein
MNGTFIREIDDECAIHLVRVRINVPFIRWSAAESSDGRPAAAASRRSDDSPAQMIRQFT